MVQKSEKAMESRQENMRLALEAADEFDHLLESSLDAHLDVICSMQKVSLEQVYSATYGIKLKTLAIDGKDLDPRPTLPLNAMFEILKRNYLYHVSRLVFEPSTRMQVVAGPDSQKKLDKIAVHPLLLFHKCLFGEAYSIDSLAAQEEDARRKSVTKLRGEIFELTCPMYVCAFVATILLQMWNDRLSSIKGNGDEGGGDSSPLSSAVPPEASATSACMVQRAITAEERAKLSVGLVKLLGRKLPSFWNIKMRRRGQLSFREFLKGVNGQGSREAKRLGRLEDACRRGWPEPRQNTGPGGENPGLSCRFGSCTLAGGDRHMIS